jgi:hypothetical protein
MQDLFNSGNTDIDEWVRRLEALPELEVIT